MKIKSKSTVSHHTYIIMYKLKSTLVRNEHNKCYTHFKIIQIKIAFNQTSICFVFSILFAFSAAHSFVIYERLTYKRQEKNIARNVCFEIKKKKKKNLKSEVKSSMFI